MLTFNVSCGSHRRAVHQHATLLLCRFAALYSVVPRVASTLFSVRTKLIAAASWTVAMMSSLSEYGLGEDFPLTPLLWMVMAVSITLVVVGVGGMRSPPGITNHAGLFTVDSSPPRLAAGSVRIGAEMDDQSESQDAADSTLGTAGPIPGQSGEAVVNTCSVLSGVVLSNLATDRGPPAGYLLNHPPSHLLLFHSAVSLQSDLHTSRQLNGRPS